jgi:hypothetical protein
MSVCEERPSLADTKQEVQPRVGGYTGQPAMVTILSRHILVMVGMSRCADARLGVFRVVVAGDTLMLNKLYAHDYIPIKGGIFVAIVRDRW